jgi:uncharacterized MnhB-related membrane protein
MDLNVGDIIELLGPGKGDLIYNIFLYFIFFFALLGLLLMPDKNLLPTLLMGGVLLATLVAKLSISSSPPIIGTKDFGMLIVNISMFVLPLLAAGMVRAKKKAGAVIPAIITALFGFVYFFMFWLLEQRA